MAKYVETVIDSHHDRIAFACKMGTVIDRPRARSSHEPSAVQPNHHWPPPPIAESLCPDIEEQAILIADLRFLRDWEDARELNSVASAISFQGSGFCGGMNRSAPTGSAP